MMTGLFSKPPIKRLSLLIRIYIEESGSLIFGKPRTAGILSLTIYVCFKEQRGNVSPANLATSGAHAPVDDRTIQL